MNNRQDLIDFQNDVDLQPSLTVRLEKYEEEEDEDDSEDKKFTIL